MSQPVELAVHALLEAIGENPTREGLRETPARLARFYHDFIRHRSDPCPLTVFDSEGMDEMIVVGEIPFYSLCEHHLLPFFGTATVGYVPNGKIVGLSKLPRLVRHFAQGLQNQERVTSQVADHLVTGLHPKGVGVVLTARHLCMEMRGVQVIGATTTTSALRGVFMDDARCRREFWEFHRTRAGT